ncbi:hypothetical protein [Bradyrhizobium sp. AZCC 1693]
MPVQKEQKVLVARIILALVAFNLLFLFIELAINVVRVYFG